MYICTFIYIDRIFCEAKPPHPHTLNPTQTAYAMAFKTGALERLSDWERFALLTACLCHGSLSLCPPPPPPALSFPFSLSNPPSLSLSRLERVPPPPPSPTPRDLLFSLSLPPSLPPSFSPGNAARFSPPASVMVLLSCHADNAAQVF